MGEDIMKQSMKKTKRLFSCIFACCILIFVMIGCGSPDRSGTDDAADDMNQAEELSENGFIADCGFKEDEPFWEYYTEEGSLQLVLYYDEASKEGCGVRYYPEEENKQEEGFRFSVGLFDEPQYSVMEAWADLARNSTLSCKRSTGKTAVSEYEESEERFENWPYDMKHFASQGIVKSAEAGNSSNLVEIDWSYRNDDTLQRKEYRHNPQVFGTYRSSAEYYYGEDEKLLYQKFKTDYGSGETYYIYGEDEIVPEYYLHIDQNQGIAELVSYDAEIPDEDKLNLDEERILEQFTYAPPFYADIDHYDDEGNATVHVYETVENEDESHTATGDWITVNPDTGIGVNFYGEIVDIIQEEEKILYYRFLNGQIEAVRSGTVDSQEILRSYYEYEHGSLPYTYVDLNDDDVEELIIYPAGIFMQILSIDHDEVCWVESSFYSGATGEIVNENKEIVMVDESHAGRSQYSVYRLNDEKELEDIIFFQVWFAGEFSGLQEDEYTQYIGGMEKGTEEVITKDEFNALYEKYVRNGLDVEWKRFEPKEF